MECEECKKFRSQVNLIDESKNCIVHGYGNYNSEILFIGEGPGKDGAALTCVPFTKDYSGLVFQKSISTLGYSNNNPKKIDGNFIPNENSLKCFITNVFRCYSYKLKVNKDILKNYQMHCLSHLKDEINKLKNLKKIVIIGKSYTKAPIKGYIEKLKSNYEMKFVTHPAYYKRNGYTIEESVKKFLEEFNN
tara:strand:+ start:2274 stop:2846 length:573 start_codon:yes stop_codon:yes gene_type:complete